MVSVYRVKTPIGVVTVTEADGAVTRLYVPGQPAPEPCGVPQTSAEKELQEYFNAERRSFTLPLRLEGTSFQLAVWRELSQVPYGQTCSYAQLAAKAGRPAAVRACGQAMARNPLPILLPCHRVVYSAGKRQQYLGGEEMKQFLLRLEQHGS